VSKARRPIQPKRRSSASSQPFFVSIFDDPLANIGVVKAHFPQFSMTWMPFTIVVRGTFHSSAAASNRVEKMGCHTTFDVLRVLTDAGLSIERPFVDSEGSRDRTFLTAKGVSSENRHCRWGSNSWPKQAFRTLTSTRNISVSRKDLGGNQRDRRVGSQWKADPMMMLFKFSDGCINSNQRR
jgi:hypothetical protein